MINKLPMSFDWRTAKQHNTSTGMYNQPVTNKGNVSELVQSILMHIQNRVKRTTDVNGYKANGSNPYNYVVNTFTNPVMMAYIMQHKLDGSDIMYIATQLKQDPDNQKFITENGFMREANEHEDYIEISPQVILKTIVDKCL